MKRKTRKILVTVIALIIVFSTGMLAYLLRGSGYMKSIEIQDVDISNVEDGSYIGEFDKYRWKNKVNVDVVDGRIESIEVISTLRFEVEEVTEEIIDRVITRQSLKVDVVSGSTLSSNAYLKAIENAILLR